MGGPYEFAGGGDNDRSRFDDSFLAFVRASKCVGAFPLHYTAIFVLSGPLPPIPACRSYCPGRYADRQMVVSGPFIPATGSDFGNGKWRMRSMSSSDGALGQMSQC